MTLSKVRCHRLRGCEYRLVHRLWPTTPKTLTPTRTDSIDDFFNTAEGIPGKRGLRKIRQSDP